MKMVNENSRDGLKRLHKKGKNWIALGVAASVIGTIAPAITPVVFAATENEAQLAENTSLKITEKVNLVMGSNIDSVDKSLITSILTDHGFTVSNVEDVNNTHIYLGDGTNNADLGSVRNQLGVKDAATLKTNGYVINVNSAKNSIFLEGKDDTGLFYAIKDLQKMVKNGAVNDVNVVQQPDMGTRGVIEGFYKKTGPGWSAQDRLDQMKFYGDNRMNMYIYAPKDDPLHRAQWRTPYSGQALTEMEALVKASKENKVDFVFAMSPGIDIKLSGPNAESDFQALVAKFQTMYDMGVRRFAIFFDDISNKDGVAQAKLLNRFNKEFVKAKGDVKPLITVPTEYDTGGMQVANVIKKYTKDFSSTLDDDIIVMWTGSAVVPNGVSSADADYVKSIYHDRVGLWWNYPTNDYKLNKLAMGPIYDLSPELGQKIDFMVMNPMGDALLSKITLKTGSEYMWNTATYNSEDSFKNAIDEEFGDMSNDFYTFANHSTRLDDPYFATGRPDAPEVRSEMDKFLQKVATVEDPTTLDAYTKLIKEFAQMQQASQNITQYLTSNNPTELGWISGNLKKLADLGKNDEKALNLLIEKVQRTPDTNKIVKLEGELKAALPELKTGKLLSEKTALAFIEEALNYDLKLKADFKAETTVSTTGTKIKLQNLSSVSAGELIWETSGGKIDNTDEKNITVTYDKPGLYSITLTAKNKFGQDVMSKTDYIRITEGSIDTSDFLINDSSEIKDNTIYTVFENSLDHILVDTAGGNEGWVVDSTTKNVNESSGWVLTKVDNGFELKSTATNQTIKKTIKNLNGTKYVTTDKFNNEEKAIFTLEKVDGGFILRKEDGLYITTNKERNYATYTSDKTIATTFNLASFFEVNKNALKDAILKAEKINLNNYTAVSSKEVSDALSAAKALVENNNSSQQQVDEAINKLQSAINKLTKKADTTELASLIKKAKDIKESEYTQDSYKKLKDVITENEVLVNNPSVSQTEINKAINDLQAAIDGLVKKENNGGGNSGNNGGGNSGNNNSGKNNSGNEQKPDKPELDIQKLDTVGTIQYVPGYGVLLRDKNGKIPATKQYLQHGTSWKVNAKKVINGVTYYRLGNDNQWVEAKYLNLKGENPIIKLNKIGKVVYHGKGGVLLLNKDGQIPAKRQYLKNNTSWKVNAKTTVNGRTLYRLGTNDQWIPAQYLNL